MSSRTASLLSLLPAQLLFAVLSHAQSADDASQPSLPQIADEPRTIDPATLMPPPLAARASRNFADSSLREVVAWLQQEQNLVVLLERSALADIGISPAEPISDRLDDAPIYLLLNRLRSLGLAWYYDDEVLHITSAANAEQHFATQTYQVGDLLDAGYSLDQLYDVITDTVSPDGWEEVGGLGVLSSLGDVLFVRQSDRVQRDVQGLLTALRQHARQTFVNDPPEHVALRGKVDENISVDFLDAPLETAVRRVAEHSGADIRLDLPALRQLRIRQREPITLDLSNRKLETVLEATVVNLKLTWYIRDGVLWITSGEQAAEYLKTAVYDVRDLCRDTAETDALIDALTSQIAPDSWDILGGPASINSPKPGTLVISHRGRTQMKIIELLETYREALRNSKPRRREQDDPNRIETVYYRLHANVARDLAVLLPKLVQSDTWKNGTNTDAVGEAVLISSPPELSNAKGAAELRPTAGELVIARSVLIVRQTRAVHDEIENIVHRIEHGDSWMLPGKGIGGAGLGGGGFGGGFFSLPDRANSRFDAKSPGREVANEEARQ